MQERWAKGKTPSLPSLKAYGHVSAVRFEWQRALALPLHS